MRVFLIWQHPLFRDLVLAILQQAGVSLVGEYDGAGLLPDLGALQLDAILVEKEGGEELAWVFNQLSKLDDVRLVSISLADNTMSIYHFLREERTLSQVDDLAQAFLA